MAKLNVEGTAEQTPVGLVAVMIHLLVYIVLRRLGVRPSGPATENVVVCLNMDQRVPIVRTGTNPAFGRGTGLGARRGGRRCGRTTITGSARTQERGHRRLFLSQVTLIREDSCGEDEEEVKVVDVAQTDLVWGGDRTHWIPPLTCATSGASPTWTHFLV